MQVTALSHSLETLHDGLTTFSDGVPTPMPLAATTIAVQIRTGLAIVRTTRSFRNIEDTPIEAVMTFPVGFDATVTELAATIDGRRLLGAVQQQSEARATYEAALDEGRLSILHEEALRGIHILSVGALPPGAEVAVELEQVMPLVAVDGMPFLRLPMTAGQLYGTSPLIAIDDLVTSSAARHVAALSVSVDSGRAVLHGQPLAPDATVEILLNRAVELRIEGGTFGQHCGKASDGRLVQVTLEPVVSGEAALDLHVIVDRSGSTGSRVRDGAESVWEAMRNGLSQELARLRVSDRITLWQFDNRCEELGSAQGPACARLAGRLEGPRGGTELAGAIRAALEKGARDILLLTDGQTWAHQVEELKGTGPRISAILAGPGSLDANIGHLCSMTGGQVLYAPGRDVASALRTAFVTLRQHGSSVKGEVDGTGPKMITTLRGGVRIRAEWSEEAGKSHPGATAIGRFAAALALPLLSEDEARALAVSHSLCTHLTSLVLVDDAGEATGGFAKMRKIPLMESMVWSDPAVSMSMSVIALDEGEQEASQAQSQRSRTTVRAHPVIDAQPAPFTHQHAPIRPSITSIQNLLSKLGLSWPKDSSKDDKKDPTEQLFAGFDWNVHGQALLAGNFSILTGSQQEAVAQLEERILAEQRKQGGKAVLTLDARLIALGIIAHRCRDRGANDFARQALQDAPLWALSVG